MSLTIYDVAIPTMLRGLAVLSSYLDKASVFALEKGLDSRALIDARLAPDMFTFGQQIQRASDKAKNGIARLAGVEAPKFEDSEVSIDDFKDRLTKTIGFLRSVDTKMLEGSESRLLDLKLRAATGTFRGDAYLLSILLPDFFFHVATAHAILRNQGVQIGKVDYFGRL